MYNKNLCFGCMENKDNTDKCLRCGYEEGGKPESTLHLPPGSILENKYLLGRVLGQGGFGITYLAWDLRLNLKLAIKEYLPQELAYRNPGSHNISVYKKTLASHFTYGLKKYLEEARTLARFAGHPGIVWVRDYFETYNTGYIVMEYIEGITLKEYLSNNRAPLPFNQTLSIFMPVLDTLKEVHASNILHRDISPDNLLISNKGRIVLIDFGAARQAVSEQNRSLSIIMKPGFSPAEQYHSKGKQGPWTDIYSVAASIFYAVTGSSPPESISRLGEDTLEPPSAYGIEITPLFERTLLKALAVNAEDRYQSVKEFQAELLKAGASQSLQPDQASQLSDTAFFVSKKKFPYAAVFVLSVLIIIGGLSLFGSGKETANPTNEEMMQDAVELYNEETGRINAVQVGEEEKASSAIDPTFLASLDADYYIDYTGGTIPLSDIPIGARVIDPSWEWEYRLGVNYSDLFWGGDPISSGMVKPVTWIVVGHDHYDIDERHVTLLSEDLIATFAFDDSTNWNHDYSEYGYNHWGESGTGNARHGLRPWLNSAGIHSSEGFYGSFSENFKGIVITTTLPNREGKEGNPYTTSDKVFVPSATELNFTEDYLTYQIGSVYAYFAGAGDEERIAMMVGDEWYKLIEIAYGEDFIEEWDIYSNNWFYWTRSPILNYGNRVRRISSVGAFSGYRFAYRDNCGVRPALNLKSESLVSEINY